MSNKIEYDDNAIGELATKPNTTKNAELVEAWIYEKALEAVFHAKPNGIFEDFDYFLVLEGRKVSEKLLTSLIAADLQKLGYNVGFTFAVSHIRSWAWEEFKKFLDLTAAEQLIERPRVVVKRKHGRPRKDNTTRTILIRAQEYGSKMQNKPQIEEIQIDQELLQQAHEEWSTKKGA